MTYHEKYHTAKTWLERVQIINLFHQIQVTKVPRWGYRDTAKYFEMGLGNVSDSLKLARNHDRIKHFKYRDLALKYLKGKV